MSHLHDFIADYTSSEYFMLLDTTLKEYAEPLLDQFCGLLGEVVSIGAIEAGLQSMARMDLPLSVRKEIPKLVAAFFEFIGTTGRDPCALQWVDDVATVEKGYQALFRDDGTVRGSTYEKRYTPTGRNDPCPCGSGKKFKKCCG